jgi:hypothetical protein
MGDADPPRNRRARHRRALDQPVRRARGGVLEALRLELQAALALEGATLNRLREARRRVSEIIERLEEPPCPGDGRWPSGSLLRSCLRSTFGVACVRRLLVGFRLERETARLPTLTTTLETTAR